MKKRILSLALTLCMLLSLLPTAALAATDGDIVVAGTTVSGSDISYWKSNGTGGIKAGTDNDYILKYEPVSVTGTSDTLTLKDAAISYSGGNTIYSVQKSYIVILEGTNTVTSTSTGDDAAFNTISSGSITFKGAGTLTAKGKYGGIYSFVDITIESGTITSEGEVAGISCNRGTLTVTGGDVTGISTTNTGYGIGKDWGGTLGLNISGGTVTAIGKNGGKATGGVNANTTHDVYAGDVADGPGAALVDTPDATTWAKPYVKLEPGKTISGTITGDGTSALEGATVQIQKSGSNFGAAATTAANGTYTTQTVPQGTYTLKVTKSGYADATVASVTVASTAVTNKDATLTPVGVYVGDVALNATTPYWKNEASNATADASGYNAYFNKNTNTLTLKDANIPADKYNVSSDGSYCSIYATKGLNLVLKGTNTVTGATAAVNQASIGVKVEDGAGATLEISGTGSLTVTGGTASGTGSSYGIYSDNGLIITGGTVTAKGDTSAMPDAPNLTGYVNHQITAATNVDGVTGVETYNANNIANYKYLKIEPGTPPTPPPSNDDDDDTYYTIKATAGIGGAISPKGNVSVIERSNKTFTIKPNEGYEIKDVLVDGVSVGAVTTYTFEKVTKRHTIEAIFAKVWANPFTDVTRDDPFYEAVEYVQKEGLMLGTAEDTFTPNGTFSRAMTATVLYRLEREPVAKVIAQFDDIVSGAYYVDALNWGIENGVAIGYGNGKFGPEDPISREQLITMLWRSVGQPEVSTPAPAGVSRWAAQAMAWASKQGLLEPFGDTLNSQAPATRAEIASLLASLFQQVESS